MPPEVVVPATVCGNVIEPPQAVPVEERTPAVNVAQPEPPVRTMSLAAKVCTADQDCARFSSATVPVFAGSVAVTVPSAPVAGAKVIEPDVAFRNCTPPAVVPVTPRISCGDAAVKVCAPVQV